MVSEAWLAWSMLFGAIGFGYLLYAHRQRAVLPMVSGVALLVLPYLLNNLWLLVALSLAAMLAPLFIRT